MFSRHLLNGGSRWSLDSEKNAPSFDRSRYNVDGGALVQTLETTPVGFVMVCLKIPTGLSWLIMVYHDKIVPFPNSTGLSWWIKSSPMAMAIDIIDWGVPVFRHSWSSLRMFFQLGWAIWERNADIHSRSLFLWCLFKSHVINLADQLILGCTPHRHVLNWVEKLGFLDLSLKLGRGRAGTSFVVDISKVVHQFAPLFCIMLHLCSKLNVSAKRRPVTNSLSLQTRTSQQKSSRCWSVERMVWCLFGLWTVWTPWFVVSSWLGF